MVCWFNKLQVVALILFRPTKSFFGVLTLDSKLTTSSGCCGLQKLGTKGSSKSSSRLSEIWPLAKSISGKMVHSGHHARRAVQLWYSKTLPGSTDMTGL